MNEGDRPMPRRITRRQLLKGAAGATALAATARWMMPDRAEDTLVVNFQGGEVGDIFQETTIEPFEKKFGVKVIHDRVGMASQDYAKIRASKGDPGFDVAAGLTAPEIILGAKEGFLEKISERDVPNVKYMWHNTRNAIPPYGIVHNVQFTVLYYNDGKIARPDSWRDYWEPGSRYGEEIRYRVLQVKPGSILCHFTLIMGARLGGGDIHNMEPAFELLEKQRPYIGLSEQSSSKMAPYFEAGDIWLAPYWSARAAFYIERGGPMKMTIPKEGSLALPNTTAIPVGSRNKRLAFEFLNFRLEREVQRAHCLAYHISPGRSDMGDWPQDYADQQVTTQEQMDAMIFPDFEVIAASRREWSLRWQNIMAS